jgi:hypothetical protein
MRGRNHVRLTDLPSLSRASQRCVRRTDLPNLSRERSIDLIRLPSFVDAFVFSGTWTAPVQRACSF